MRMLVLAAAAVVAVVFGAAVAWVLADRTRESAGIIPYQDAEAVALGQEIYGGYCASCHGANLEGQPNWRQTDAEGYLPAPPHDRTGHTWHHPDRQLLAITMHGTEKMVGGTYKSRMAGYSEVLQQHEIIAVLAYIKSRWPPDVIERHNQINQDAAQE